MTDEEWRFIEPFMPPQPKKGRRRSTPLRSVIDAIFYLLQTGCQWAMLPKDFPPTSTVHGYFKRFEGDDTWVRIHDAVYRLSLIHISEPTRRTPISYAVFCLKKKKKKKQQ